MARLGPNPGFVFQEGADHTGAVWTTELIAIIDKFTMDAQADSTATTVADLRTDFNSLLAKLRTAGLMEN